MSRTALLLPLLALALLAGCDNRPVPSQAAASPDAELAAADAQPAADASQATSHATTVPAVEPDAPNTPPLLVFAAASTSDALTEIDTAFTAATGIRVEESFAASSALARQIIQGAPADVFISANEKWADAVSKADLVADRRPLLGNALVAIVPADSRLRLSAPEDLATTRVKLLALADPESVPAGIYARQALTKLMLWQPVEDRVVSGADVRHALAYVERGEADAGIVYATDAAISDRVRVAFKFDRRLTDPIIYPIELTRRGSANPSARLYYEFLAGDEAAAFFERAGFERLTPPIDNDAPTSEATHGTD